MTLGNLMGEGSLGGEGSITGEGSTAVASDGSNYLSSAMITARDGIVENWKALDHGPGDATADLGSQMQHWEARVRAHVLDFELLSAFRLKVEANEPSPGQATAILLSGQSNTELVRLIRPTTKTLRLCQVQHVYNYADLRRDRAAEILTQVRGVDIFLGRSCPLHPERHPRTLELMAAFFRALVAVEMRIKHALAVPRPMDFSWQAMPMIQTPGHGSFPAGHAAESFMLATVLSAVMRQANPRYADWNEPLARLASRISVNRLIAGVHFPVDLAAGLVLGLTLGRYFIALAGGTKEAWKSYTFDGEKYAGGDFPWTQFCWAKLLESNLPRLEDALLCNKTIEPDPIDENKSPLFWLWKQAVQEWK
ncbi:MAG: phosphatase PAP2 family protein [Acetobacteraceae bacterium]